jgi:hypothetical protein
MGVVYELICSNPDCQKKFSASKSNASTCSSACRSILSRNRTVVKNFIKNSTFTQESEYSNSRMDFFIDGNPISNDKVQELQMEWNLKNRLPNQWLVEDGRIYAIILSKEFKKEYNIVFIKK